MLSHLALMIFCLCLVNQVSSQQVSSQTPKLGIDYWLNGYKQVTAGEKYELAQKVFKKTISVADNPADEVYALYIFADLRLTQVFALPDGAIILPLKAIDLCLQDRQAAETRLAFLLGHEIKHLIRRDYWILDQITQFLANAKQQGLEPDLARLMESVKWDFQNKLRKLAETEADKSGILYASLAGYDAGAIFDFIPEYYRAAGIDVHGDVTNNSVNDRIRALQERLGDAIEHLHLFDFGVQLYAIGQYDAAIECLAKFVTQYPSREVFNNLGLCHYQKALSLYAKWKPEDIETNPNFAFKLSAQIDPLSRLRGIPSRGTGDNYEKQVEEVLNRCIEHLEKAKDLDPDYEVSYNNLGCAHLLKGDVDFAKGYLKKAVALNQSYQEAYNNLGVCYAAEGLAEAAKNSFLQASRIAPNYADPIFNLGQLYRVAGRDQEAREQFRRYLELDKWSKPANRARGYLGMPLSPTKLPVSNEAIAGRFPRDLRRLDGNARRAFRSSEAEMWIDLNESQSVRCFYYQSQSDLRIAIIAAGEKYRGQTQNQIKIGDPAQLVEQRYLYPRHIVPATRGEFWVFEALGLVFEMREGKVHGWFLFDLM